MERTLAQGGSLAAIVTPAPRGCSFAELTARAAEWMRSWPASVRAESWRTKSGRGGSGRRRTPAGGWSPYWTELPVELARRSRGRVPRRVLRDILWGQFCLFFLVRIQDDLFDGEAEDRRLIYVADQFLIESERAFGRHFSRSSSFWITFHEALETTTRAILRVDRLQTRASGDGAELPRVYADVAAIFNVAIAAVCLLTRQPRMRSALSRFGDEMAIGGQIIDDLEDLGEDMARGRFNYVAQRLLSAAPGAEGALGARVAAELVLGEGGTRILAEVRRHLLAAENAVRFVDCAAADEEVRASLRSLDRVQAHLHRRSVELALGPALGRRPARSA